jgi:Lon protease-like protein
MTLGRIPVFPLPDVVLFPDTTLGLHIFEPRYRSMTEDALRSERLIAMAVLKPGGERDDQGNPEVYRTACAGVIESEARQPDGRYNIRLRGFARIEIDRFVQEQPYRIAAVRILADRNDADGSRVEQDRKRLLSACTSLLQEVSGESSRPVAIDLDVPFAVVVNTLCHSLALEPDIKQRLLELDDVGVRCRALIDILEERWKEIALAREIGGAGPHEVH